MFRSSHHFAASAALFVMVAVITVTMLTGTAVGGNDEIVNKNLFSSDRKPPQPPPPPKPPPEVGLAELKQVKLLAVYTLGASKKALVYAPNSVIQNKKKAKGGKKVWIRVGNALAGYKVTAISHGVVTLKNEDGDEYVMRLRPENKKIIQ